MRTPLAALLAAATCGIGLATGLLLAGDDAAPDDTPVMAGDSASYLSWSDLPQQKSSEDDMIESIDVVRDGSYPVTFAQGGGATVQEGVYSLVPDAKAYDPGHPERGGCTWQVATDPGSFQRAARSPMWRYPTADRTTIVLGTGNYFVSVGCGAWTRVDQ